MGSVPVSMGMATLKERNKYLLASGWVGVIEVLETPARPLRYPDRHMIRAAIPSAVAIARPRRADPPAAFLAFFGARRLRGSISPAAANSIAQAIQQQEGYYPGSVAYRNNNPGNLVYAGQAGATPGAGGFASFSSYDAGYQAMLNQIALDASRGTDASGNPTTTVSQLITSWAPPSENNTAAYVSNVSAATGFDPNASLSSLGTGSSLPTFAVDVYGAGPDPSQTDSLDLGSGSDSGLDLASVTSGTVDLSSIGLSSSVPWWWLALGALGVVALSRR